MDQARPADPAVDDEDELWDRVVDRVIGVKFRPDLLRGFVRPTGLPDDSPAAWKNEFAGTTAPAIRVRMGATMPEKTALYPDLTAAGGLGNALQGALTAIGSPLTVPRSAKPVNFVAYARVESGSRFSQVFIAADERLFLFDFWSRGVLLARGRTPDLVEVARVIDRWVGSGCTTTELASGCDFVAVEPAAAAYESGDEVEHRWRDYLANIGSIFPDLAAFVRAASRRRELRQLFPFTSHERFCFSRCTGYPFTGDTPHVCPRGEGQYEVLGPTGRVLGRGDAETAAGLVVEHLPAGCGPAVPGTADTIPR